MTEPQRVAGVLIALDDARYLVEAIDMFGALALSKGANLTPRIARLRAALATATHDTTDEIARTSESQPLWGALSAHDLLDSTEAAAVLGCTPGNVRDLARRGAIAAYRSGARWLYPADAIEQRARHVA